MNHSLIVLRHLLDDPVFAAYLNYVKSGCEEDFAVFVNLLFSAKAEQNFAAYVSDKIVFDENVFSVSCAKKEEPSPFVTRAFLRDLSLINDLLYGNALRSDLYEIKGIDTLLTGNWGNETTLKLLQEFYAQYGYGQFIRNKAFRFEQNELRPVTSPSKIQLSDLKGYETEKKAVSDNIESFLSDLPFSNMLLYGDRGTGKSSTIHAMLNKYYPRGLRVVELAKEHLTDLTALKDKLSDIPLKFIVFIDDLALNDCDEKFSVLKAALEGSVSGHAENTMIVATSNRRHIIKESFSDREEAVHRNDQLQEQLSLSDRFGITVLFSTTGKSEYLDIVRRLAADRALSCPPERLDMLAERWALVKGGRSPRRAKQFVDLAYACEQKGLDITF